MVVKELFNSVQTCLFYIQNINSRNFTDKLLLSLVYTFPLPSTSRVQGSQVGKASEKSDLAPSLFELWVRKEGAEGYPECNALLHGHLGLGSHPRSNNSTQGKLRQVHLPGLENPGG